MESVWKFKTDGKTGIYSITFHNEPFQVIFGKVPPADTEIEIKIKENKNDKKRTQESGGWYLM